MEQPPFNQDAPSKEFAGQELIDSIKDRIYYTLETLNSLNFLLDDETNPKKISELKAKIAREEKDLNAFKEEVAELEAKR